MKASEVREKYINFFKSPPRNHKEISPAPLVPEGDPTTLFTSSGMQQLVPYLMGEKHPEGKRLVDSQPCIRLQDIEEVGDNHHTTYFEMLGNWSLGSYFKKEQLPWFWSFLTKVLNLSPERLYVSVYKGDKKIGVEKDLESVEIWKEIFQKEGINAIDIDSAEKEGMQGGRIFYYKDNWWSRSGLPKEMPPGEIGGPDSEVYYKFPKIKHDSKYGKHCHPDCQCGRYLEIGNSVFIQYKKCKDGSFVELPQKNVDFGGGLERFVAAENDNPDIFMIDVIRPLVSSIEKELSIEYGRSEDTDKSIRVIVDHLRGAAILISEGVLPSNKVQGYILRRLIRRAMFHLYLLTKHDLTAPSLAIFWDVAGGGRETREVIQSVVREERDRFGKALDRGLMKLVNAIEKERSIDGKFVFDLYQTDGFPMELTLEILDKEGIKFSEKEKEDFEKEFEKHKKLSKTASAGVFKGGLADKSVETTKLHTAAHLLQASLRKVLGESVEQKGQNITAERLRFDFSHPQKLTDRQLKRVEDLMNVQIDNDLDVSYEVKTIEEAKKEGALAFFKEKYGEKVNVYTISDPGKGWFSKEVCGGPHVKRTSEIGHVRIRKQEKIGAGIVRIYVVLEKDNNT